VTQRAVQADCSSLSYCNSRSSRPVQHTCCEDGGQRRLPKSRLAVCIEILCFHALGRAWAPSLVASTRMLLHSNDWWLCCFRRSTTAALAYCCTCNVARQAGRQAGSVSGLCTQGMHTVEFAAAADVQTVSLCACCCLKSQSKGRIPRSCLKAGVTKTVTADWDRYSLLGTL
jgi:hypothetical protein